MYPGKSLIKPVSLFRYFLVILILPILFGCTVPVKKTESCTYLHRDEGVVTMDNCFSRDDEGRSVITPDNIKNCRFNSDGLSAVHNETEGWMYVDRSGKIIVSHVAVMDNWADDFHDGLVRVHRGDKWGFANTKGEMVVPPIYDGALNFENGFTWVCSGCKAGYQKDGEYQIFLGGKWKRIDTSGIILHNSQ
jgi:hypothetical protein